ncbi:MAG: hypothetical protein RL069_2150, partial [Planctomycetota bacterium]
MSSKYGFDRRQWVRSAVAGSMVLPALVERLMAQSGDPLAPKESHFPAKAKNVIFLFMTGGVSHVDTWDPKPELISGHGKEIKADHPEIKDRPGYERIFLKKPQWEFRKHGECGTEVSSLFPHMATCVDDIALIRSMHTSHSNHYNATLGMHTGSFAQSRPSMGAWVTYGLGTLNRNLPGFVVIAPRQTYAGTQVYASDFLPGAYQGTLVVPGSEPIANIAPRLPQDRQSMELEFLEESNREHLQSRQGDGLLESRMQSFKTAFGMQMEVPDAFDFSDESQATL